MKIFTFDVKLLMNYITGIDNLCCVNFHMIHQMNRFDYSLNDLKLN